MRTVGEERRDDYHVIHASAPRADCTIPENRFIIARDMHAHREARNTVPSAVSERCISRSPCDAPTRVRDAIVMLDTIR